MIPSALTPLCVSACRTWGGARWLVHLQQVCVVQARTLPGVGGGCASCVEQACTAVPASHSGAGPEPEPVLLCLQV